MRTLKDIMREIDDCNRKIDDKTLAESTRKNYLSKAKRLVKDYNLGEEGASSWKGLNFTYTLPTSGIYLIGMKFFWNSEDTKPIFALKVGMSTKINQRLKSYPTYNPGVRLLDIYYTGEPIEWESSFQDQLSALFPGIFYGSSEWHLVNEEMYKLAEKHGLHCFYHYVKNQTKKG